MKKLDKAALKKVSGGGGSSHGGGKGGYSNSSVNSFSLVSIGSGNRS